MVVILSIRRQVLETACAGASVVLGAGGEEVGRPEETRAR